MSTLDPFSPLIPRANVSAARSFHQPQPETITFENGQVVPAAVPDHPESKAYYLKGGDGLYHEITRDESFVQQVYLHYTYGAEIGNEATAAVFIEQGVAEPWGITQSDMRAAVLAMPTVLNLIVSSGLSEAQVWSYVQTEAPFAIDLVGVAPAH